LTPKTLSEQNTSSFSLDLFSPTLGVSSQSWEISFETPGGGKKGRKKDKAIDRCVTLNAKVLLNGFNVEQIVFFLFDQ
jgi:hypothetical protein